MVEPKILMVSEDVRKKLWELKIANNLKSHNEAIMLLLEEYDKRN